MQSVRSEPRPALVPELKVTCIEASLRFWRDLVGFRVLYDRAGFAAIERDGVEFMLDQDEIGPADRIGIWETGSREYPFGRGINFEITIGGLAELLSDIRAAQWPIFFGPEEKWYRVGEEEVGVRQFLVQDPDGYLIRFSQSIGRRRAVSTSAIPSDLPIPRSACPMFSVEVRDRIMIGHSLPDPFFGPAQAMHGATFVVDVAFFRERLTRQNVVVDIGAALETLAGVLKPLKYRNLDEVPEFAGVLTTTEFLCKHIFDGVATAAREGALGEDGKSLAKIRVTLHETDLARACYEGALA